MESVKPKHVCGVILKNKKCLCSAAIGALFIIISFLLTILDPVAYMAAYCTKVNNESYIYKKLQNKVETIHAYLYVFNITNGDRFIAGLDKKLKLEEVGPFVFRDIRDNYDLEVDEEKKLLRYTPVSNVTFVPELSVGDPKDIKVTVPNFIFLMLASRLSRESFILKSTFSFLVSQQRFKPLMTLTVSEILFGFEDPFFKIARTVAPGLLPQDKFGILTFALDRNQAARFEVDTRDENKFLVKTINGDEGLFNLGFGNNRTTCNTFTDTYEGVLFPMPLNPKRRLRIYHPIYCRMMELEYLKDGMVDDMYQTMEYTFKRDAYDTSVPDYECYCPSKDCLRGFSEISPCFHGLPALMSQAHFLNADERAFDKLEGLKPDPKLHSTHIVIHKGISLPLKTRFTVQVNIKMYDVSYCAAAKPFSNMILPLVYGIAHQAPLPEDIQEMLEFVTYLLPKITFIIKLVLLCLGVAILVCSIWVAGYSIKKKKQRIRISEKSVLSTEKPLLIKSVETCDIKLNR